MRVLHVHKFRRVTGGVETHVHALMDAQAAAGIAVDLFTSEDLSRAGFNASPTSIREAARGASTLLWSRLAAAEFERRLALFRPDVVHFHSIYHHLSPSIIRVVSRFGARAVMTLHDYKLAAPCYVLQRDGRECRECIGKAFPHPALRHACVKGSRQASFVCAVEQFAHRPVYRGGIDRFLVPSAYARDIFVSAGVVAPEKIVVAPLGVAIPDTPARPSGSKTILFFGRVAQEKGVAQLLSAWARADLPEPWRLSIVGDGPLLEGLRETCPTRVSFTGHLTRGAVAAELRSAAVVVVPSVFPETFGLSAAEGMASGIPVLVSDVGNLAALLGDSRQVLRAGDDEEWARALRRLATDPKLRDALGRQNRARVTAHFSESAALTHVLDAYSVAGRALDCAPGSYALA